MADSSFEYDQDVKIPACAEDAVAEVWLVDLNGEAIEVYREPSPAGYQSVQQYRRGQVLSIAALPDVAIAVVEVLG